MISNMRSVLYASLLSFSFACAEQTTTIEKDVAIIGGGSAGTYAAIRLQQMGLSVALLEKEDRLGGHVNTYFQPKTNAHTEYGVQIYTNGSTTLNYFAHFNLPLQSSTKGASTTTTYYTNFLNGEQLNTSVALPGSLVTAFTTYVELLNKYSYINGAWDLPNPVPEDLLMPWGDFVTKYKLEPMQTIVYSYNQGQGNILAQPAMYVLRQLSMPQVLGISSGFLVNPAGNQVLYDRALAELGSSAYLNAKVDRVTRSESGVEICVTTCEGTITIKAKKLILAIPPLLRNLPFMDLDANERALYGQFNSSYYWNALVENAGLPASSRYLNLNPNAALNMPAQPAVYLAGSSSISGLSTVYYGSAHYMSDSAVQADMATTIARLRRSLNATAPSGDLKFLGFQNHSPYTLAVTPDAIRGGFYSNLKALQGERSTYYTGAMWANDASGEIWNFTEYEILPKIVKPQNGTNLTF